MRHFPSTPPRHRCDRRPVAGRGRLRRREPELRAPWFKTDPDPRGHGLDGIAADQREVRITIVIPSGDRALRQWLTFTRTPRSRRAAACIEQLIRPGGQREGETWSVSPHQIPPTEFRAIEVRRPDGSDTRIEPGDLAAMVPHEGLEEEVRAEFRDMRTRTRFRAASPALAFPARRSISRRR
ncbi:hypothetical protein M446_0123 [Methylobacterium sp. 4-46]|nr:hypothetical protein M446_0123 [Methylobacterium sp. 4-46]